MTVVPEPQEFEELKFEAKQTSFEWRIDDFLANQPYMDDTLTSRPFPRESVPQWRLEMLPRGVYGGILKFCVDLTLNKCDKEFPIVDFTISFLDDNRSKIVTDVHSESLMSEPEGFFILNTSTEAIPVSKSGKLIVRVDITTREKIVADPCKPQPDQSGQEESVRLDQQPSERPKRKKSQKS